MSITRTGSPSGVIRLSAPMKDRRASVSPLITSGCTPSRSSMPRKKLSRFLASRAAEVATKCTFLDGHLGFLDQFRVVVDRREGAAQSVGVELTCGVDPLAEAYDLQPPLQIVQTAGTVRFGDQQTDGIRSAVDGGNSRHETSSKHGCVQNAPSARAASSPSGLTPSPAASE